MPTPIITDKKKTVNRGAKSYAPRIKPTGEITLVELPNGELERLSVLQKAVGGYIEPILLDDNYVLLCNEEGKIKKLALNMMASQMTKYKHMIVGDALIMELSKRNGIMNLKGFAKGNAYRVAHKVLSQWE